MKLKQSVALQRLSKSFIERLYEDGKIQEAFIAEHINQLYDYLSDKESLEKLTSPEFIKALKKENDIQYEINHPTLSDKEEASKGEYLQTWDKTTEWNKPKISVIPPQQEESRGECENCGVNKPGGVIAATSDLKHCAVCGRDLFPEDNFPEPQLKEESPKQSEDWVKEWRECVKANFDGLNGESLGVGDIELKIRVCGEIFISSLLSKYQINLEESSKEDEVEVVFRNELAYKDEQGNYWVEESGWESVWEDIKPILKANFVSKSKLSKYVQDGIDECNEPGIRIGGVAVLREMQMAFRLEDL